MNRIAALVALVVAVTVTLAAPMLSPSSELTSEELGTETNDSLSNEIHEDSLYNNITVERRLLQFLQQYGYFTEDVQISELGDDTLLKLIKEPLMKLKEFFGLTPLDGTITDEVMRLTNKSRCADADLFVEKDEIRQKRFARRGVPWKVPQLSMSIVNYTPKLSRREQDEIMHTCARIWAEESGLNVVIKTGWAHMMATFGSIDGPGGQIALGQVPTGGRLLSLKMDRDEDWVRDNWHRAQGRGPGLLWAMCHEIGHGLGLDHVRDRNQLMFPLSQRIGNRDHTLGADDVRGVQALYGRSSHNGAQLVNQVLGPNYVEQARGPSNMPQPTTRPTAQRTTTTPRPTTTKSTTIESTTQKLSDTTTRRQMSRNLAQFRARFSHLF